MRAELEQAVNLLQSKNADSVQEALRLMQGTVLSFSMKICGQREDAEDTTQEVLAGSLRYLAKIENPRALSVWLYTAARNRCWRSRKRRLYRKLVALEDLTPHEAEQSALLASASENPEMRAARQQDYELVQQAVLRLPASYRMVLVLHDMEELDTGVVASVLGIRPGTARVRLHRARLFVRKEMDSLLHGLPKNAAQASAKPANARLPRDIQESLRVSGRPYGSEYLRTDADACPDVSGLRRFHSVSQDRLGALSQTGHSDGERNRHGVAAHDDR